ncbi:MAG: PEGA domain-containing protein [Sandaracinaceae bacterium]
MRGLSLVVALGCAIPLVAHAQDARTEAQQRFQRGLALYEEGRDDAALAEFEEAYRVAPAWQVLFNIARVHARLGHAVEAADTYARYLDEGGDAIDAARRREVETLLAEQRARIASVLIVTNAPAVISVDGVDVARTPLEAPLRFAAGEHTVAVRAEGHDPEIRSLRLAGDTLQTLTFELVRLAEADAPLDVRCEVPGVRILVDGSERGVSPLAGPLRLAPGEHVVIGRREGYRDAREQVVATGGQRSAVTLSMRAEDTAELATLRIRLPAASARVTVDGESRPQADRWDLPVGPHRVSLEVVDREPSDETVVIPREGLDHAPALVWTPEARQARVEAADAQRTAGFVVAAAGAVVLVAGGATLLADAVITSDNAMRYDRAVYCEDHRSPVPDECFPPFDFDAETQWRERFDYLTGGLLGAGVAGVAVGAAGLGVGLAIALSAPDEDAIDDEAHARVRFGPGGVSVEGTF